MARRSLALGALVLLPLFASCATTMPAEPQRLTSDTVATPLPAPTMTSEPMPAEPATPEPTAPAPRPANGATASATPSSTWTPKPRPTPTTATKPATTRPTTKPTAAKPAPTRSAKAQATKAQPTKAQAAKTKAPARPGPTASPTVKGKATTEPKETKPAVTSEACAATVVTAGTKGDCVKQGLAALKAAGYYSPKVGTSFGASAANWTVHYQRTRGLPVTATLDAATWQALRSGRGKVGEAIPDRCRAAGVNVCVNKAHQRLHWFKDGKLVKTIKVRTAGWNQDRHGAWRLHHTPAGTYRVYSKQTNPSSPRYGEGAMPYSTIFDPNMYFHYSAGFAKQGYSGSSHGCVNIASKGEAKWIMDKTPLGAKVIIY